MADSQIRLLSLNCWGLKFISKVRKERYEAIANELNKGNYDIVNLQEIWVFSEFQQLREKVSGVLPHSKFFYSGALGAGLAILSRFPFVGTSVHPYSLNGNPIDVAAGDWFVGKAAGSVVILHPVLGQVEIFNTHFFAKGGEGGPEENRAHRLVNAWEFSKLVRTSAEKGRYVIAAGDFNSIPTTLPITIIREHSGCEDSWLVAHPSSANDTTPALTPAEAIGRFGVTADSPINTWSAGKPLDDFARQFWGKRLDYVFYRQPSQVLATPRGSYPVLRCTNCRVVMTEKVPGQNYSISDHFGLESTLEIQYQTVAPTAVKTELSSATIATVIQALTACYRTSRQRARKELIIFGVSLPVLIGMAVGTTWVPVSWATPIFIVVTVALSWLATTMLYEGFLYGNWECNSLMNVTEELEIHRAGYELIHGARIPN